LPGDNLIRIDNSCIEQKVVMKVQKRLGNGSIHLNQLFGVKRDKTKQIVTKYQRFLSW
jgi:hypothetical protein